MQQGSQGSQGSPLLDRDRWEQLKPIILELYHHQKLTLPKVITIMRDEHRFFHVENTYKYYFNIWGVPKNIPTFVKDATVVALGKRIRGRQSTPDVAYIYKEGQSMPVDRKKIKRQIHDVVSRRANDERGMPLGKNVFIHWNLPYRAARSASRMDSISPFGPTPDFLSIGSPNASRGMSSRHSPSPHTAPTPTMLALRGMKQDEWTSLFIQVKHDLLMKQMARSERKVLITYLYQFWLFSFYTAKYWGFGPTHWTSDILQFDRFRDTDRVHNSSPDTPMTGMGTPLNYSTPRSDNAKIGDTTSSKPSMLCRWVIHVANHSRYEGEGDDSDDEGPDAVLGAEGSDEYRPWPRTHNQTFEQKLQAALETGNFSTVACEDLPVAASRIAKAARTSPMELLQESFAFSLVARNEKLFWNILEKVSRVTFDDSGVYPLHLLTSFLDGSKTCCNLLDGAMNNLCGRTRIEKIYVNDHGHTVLDNLFIAVLKGHTSCQPDTVDDKFAKMRRFTGEEVDICGRWDADSSCVRELFADGNSAIPIEWKHMFCHTSIQTICHCIGRLFGPIFAPKVNTPSGLFLKTCEACGMRLQMAPLHSLVLTACHLAQSGCPGENLFGMLAMLVCLLANGADPLLKAPISLEALMRKDTATECSHEYIDAIELAERVPASLILGWTEEASLGWNVFCAMLRFARDERRPPPKPSKGKGRVSEDPYQMFMEPMEEEYLYDGGSSDDGDDEEDEMGGEEDTDEEPCQHHKFNTNNFYGRSKVIGTMWAVIQTELLTYRRLSENDPWLSENFDMRSVLDGLNNGGLVPIKLVEEDMMSPFCVCGRFLDVVDEACACVGEVCSHYFANVDVWERSSYIMIPENHNGSWYW